MSCNCGQEHGCKNCPIIETCEFAYDEYNDDKVALIDCLGAK